MRVSNVKIEDRILLKKAARDGCSESLSAIYVKYQPAICDFLRKSGADEIAEDVCQTVFMEIHEGKCKYDGSSEAKSFLFGVAGNLHKNKLRTLKTETYGLSPEDVDGDLFIHQSSHEYPHAVLEDTEYFQLISSLTPLLPPKSRQAIELVYLEGFAAKTAAEISDCNFNTFRKRIDLGLQYLQEIAKKSGL